MGDYEDWNDYHFMWTQWKSNRIIASLPKHKELAME
jgi:hypothetical protein